MVDINLQDFRQLAPQARWSWERVANIRKWEKWYEGELSDLFSGQHNLMNGLNIVDPIKNGKVMNMFKASSRFFQSAGDSELPIFGGISEELEEQMVEVIIMAFKHWSISAEATVLIDNEELSVVSPDFYHPVKSPYNIQRTVGHILAYDYFKGLPPTNNIYLQANALRAVKFQKDVINQVEEYAYRPYVVGAQESSTNANIGGIWHINTRDPFYDDIKTVVREIIVRENALAASLNMTMMPYLQLDLDTISSLIGPFAKGEATIPEGWDEFSDEQKVEWLKKNTNPGSLTTAFIGGIKTNFTADTEEIYQPILPRSTDYQNIGDNNGAAYVERSGTGLRESFEYLKHCFAEVYLLTGVPPIVGGVDLSGVSKDGHEKMMFSAQAKVSRMRRRLERILVQVAKRLGHLNASITYHSEPFATLASRTNAIIFGWTSGLSQRNESRAALSQTPVEGGDVFMDQVKGEGVGDATRRVQGQTVDVSDTQSGLNNNPNGNQGDTGLVDSLEQQLMNT